MSISLTLFYAEDVNQLHFLEKTHNLWIFLCWALIAKNANININIKTVQLQTWKLMNFCQ